MHGKTSASPKPITRADVSRFQGAVARTHGGGTPKGSYGGRLQCQLAVPAKPTRQEVRLQGDAMTKKDDLDNHANRLKPNDDEYWHSRGQDERPDGAGDDDPADDES